MRLILKLSFLSLMVSCAPAPGPIDLYPLVQHLSGDDDESDFNDPIPAPHQSEESKGPAVLERTQNNLENVVVKFSKPVKSIGVLNYNHELLTESWSEDRMTLTFTFIQPVVIPTKIQHIHLAYIEDDEGETNTLGAIIILNLKK